MSANLTAILNTYGALGVEMLKQAIEKVDATGKTANSIKYEVKSTDKKDQLLLVGRAYFELLEKGIRPSGKNPSPDMIKFMTEYAKARGMDKPESAAWAISKTILKEGDRTHKQGGRIVYSDDLSKFVDELTKVLATEFSKGFLTEIKGAFKS